MQSLPTIGIFSHGRSPVETMPKLRLRAMLGEAAVQGVDIVFIGGDDCDLETGQVLAQRWSGGDWQRQPMELPPFMVVINPATTPERLALEAWLRARARVIGFRHREKLATAAMLSASAWAGHVIPAERIEPGRIEAQLAQWMQGGGIVVKATDGMRGIGITFALPAGDGWQIVRGTRRWSGTATEAVDHIARTIRARLAYRDYMVQRYVDSTDSFGQSVAIRVDLARLPEGGWGPYRVAGRIARRGARASTGVKADAILAIDTFLDGRGVLDVPPKAAELLHLAVGIADTISANDPPLSCYEMGLDFAIDAADHYWFIEANGRPEAIGVQHERVIMVMDYLKSLIQPG